MMRRFACLVLAASLLSCSDARDQLMRELSDSSPVKRAGALKVLAREGDAEAYRLLNLGLQDGSVIVRIAAVQSLAAFEGRDTVPALIRAARDADPEVREVVVAALCSRGGEQVQRTLMNMLLEREPNPLVRSKIYEGLAKLGLSGAALAQKMSAAQIEWVRKKWEGAQPAQRSRLVRIAGRSIDARGIEIVSLGLGDQDAGVVLTALEVLDGRGDKEILRKLLVLASDQSLKIRMSALRELGRRGKDGLPVIKGALRDLDPEVRLCALRELAGNQTKITADTVCPVLTDGNLEVAKYAAVLIGERGIDCDLSALAAGLGDPEDSKYLTTVMILTLLKGQSAREMLAGEMKKRPADMRPRLAAALARAGDRSKTVGRILERRLKATMDELVGMGQSWVADKLPPKKPAKQALPDENRDQFRLSEEELKKLYQKHGLPPAGEESPRGVADILKGFEEPSKTSQVRRLFLPGLDEEIEEIADLLDGLVAHGSDESHGLIVQALESDLPDLAGRIARIVTSRKVALDLPDDRLAHLGGLLEGARDEHAEAIINMIGRTKTAAAAEVLVELLPAASFELREIIIEALGSMKRPESVQQLVEMLSGYSSSSAAQALGKIGSPDAIDGLKEALDNAGPSARMSILMALAKLGCEDIVPTVAQMLSDPDPEVRQAAVTILGTLGGKQALQLLGTARYDPDRLVSAQVREYLPEKQSGDTADDRQDPEMER